MTGKRARLPVAQVAAVVATAFLLGGCFDVKYDVTLRNDGSGSISTSIVYDKQISSYAAKNGNEPQTESKILRNGKPVPHTSKKLQDGRLVEEQIVDFTRLSDLTLSDNNTVEVTDLGRSFFGMDTSRIHVGFGKVHDASKPKSIEESPEATKLIAEVMSGHYLTVTLHLPCAVSTANTLAMQGTNIAPTVDSGWLHGSTVTWVIPMALVFATSDKEAPQFDVTCRSFMGIPAGKSRG